MCHYITVILAGVFEIDEINRIAKPHSILLRGIANRFISRLLKPGEMYFANSRGHCDCGTGLCEYDNETERIHGTRRSLKQGVAKRVKLGWSKTKVARWQEQKVHEIERHNGSLDKAKPDPDCQHWADFGNELFEKTGVTCFGILVHFYSGGVSTENAANDRIIFPRKKLMADMLFRMKEDTINIFVKKQ